MNTELYDDDGDDDDIVSSGRLCVSIHGHGSSTGYWRSVLEIGCISLGAQIFNRVLYQEFQFMKEGLGHWIPINC